MRDSNEPDKVQREKEYWLGKTSPEFQAQVRQDTQQEVRSSPPISWENALATLVVILGAALYLAIALSMMDGLVQFVKWAWSN
jgi:hypothetical protein